MLVLTRRPGETLVVDGPCRIVVLGQKGNHIKVGIEADGDVGIRRGEIPPLSPAVETEATERAPAA